MYYRNNIQIDFISSNEINNQFSISHIEDNTANLQLPVSKQDFNNAKENLLYTLENLTESDIDKIYAQRQPLALKKLLKKITPQEEIDLKYIEWQIDRYEMAKYAEDFAKLESIVSSNQKAVDAILKSVGISYGK